MLNWLKQIIFNEKIKYLFWGGMTTLVYFLARFSSMMMTNSSMLPVAVAEVISIIFAFFVNKYFVFNHNQQNNSVTRQAIIFVVGRALAAGIDALLTYLMIDKFYQFFIKIFFLNHINYQGWLFTLPLLKKLIGNPIVLNSSISVIIIQIIIIVLNFFVSKYFAFK